MNKKGKIREHAPEILGKAKLVGVFESGTSEWHEARADGIGGSEVGAILGLSQYESAYSLWAKRTDKIQTEFVDNWSVRFGKAFELPILELWAEQNPEWEVFTTGTYADVENPYLRANPDAFAKHRDTGELIIIEIKTARYAWLETPPAYSAQLLHYLDVFGFARGVLVAVAGWNWWEEWLTYSEFEAGAQREALSRFWSCVVNDTAPDFDGSDATYDAVRKMHPDIDDDLEIEIDGLHTVWNLTEKFDQAKAELTKAKSEVLELMGNAKHAYIEHEGEKIRVASRQARGMGDPYLVIKKGKK